MMRPNQRERERRRRVAEGLEEEEEGIVAGHVAEEGDAVEGSKYIHPRIG